MGQFRFEFEAVGGHGCNRDAKEGDKAPGCGRMGCPDCECRRFVEYMHARGMKAAKATLTHWPGQVMEVVDDLSPATPDWEGQTTPATPRRVSNDFFNSNPKKPAG